jgi:hypothetical protein
MRTLLLGAWLALVGCGDAVGPQGDFVRPRIVAVSVTDEQTVSPTAALSVSFSEAIEAGSVGVDAVVVVPHLLGGSCTVDLACPGGVCFAGRCQSSAPVDGAWLADLAHPPLTAARQALTAPIRVELAGDGDRLIVQPVVALAPRRLHTLIIGPSLVDRAGQAIARQGELPVALLRVFATGDLEGARPVLQLVAPPAGSTDLPLNLRRLVVRFSQQLPPLAADGLWLAADDGLRVALRPLREEGACVTDAHQPCQWLAVAGPLRALTVWSLMATRTLGDLQGETLLQERPLALATGSVVDTGPPVLGEVSLLQSDGCVVVRTRTSEPADARLSASWTTTVQLTAGTLVHELALPAAPALPAGAQVRLDLQDAAGQAAAPWRHAAERASLAPLVISEVLADPLGPDPDQEWVEIYNRDDRAVELEGWAIDDGTVGADGGALPALRLQPHRYALVVGPRYRAGSGPDPFPAADVPLARLRAPIGGRGLANRGEPLFLRRPDGALASSYRGTVGTELEVPGPGRSAQRRSPAACDVATSWTRSGDDGPTPGR